MAANLAYKTKHLLFSLRFSILFIFVTLFLFTMLLIVAIRSATFEKELSYTSFGLMRYASSAVLQELNAGLRPAEIESKFSAKLIEKNILKDNVAELVPYTFYLVSTLPLVQRAFWADEDGHFIFSEKEDDGSITTEIYDFRLTPKTHKVIHRNKDGNIIKQELSINSSSSGKLESWFIQAKKEKQFFWTDIRLFHPHLHRGVTAATPVIRKGQFYGVFGLDITLGYLTEFITNQHVSRNGFSFIITKDENLVAYPEREPFTQIMNRPHQLINVHAISLPLIDASIDHFKKTGEREFTLSNQGETYLITYERVKALEKYGWLIGVVTPRSDFISALQKLNLITLIVNLIILIIGIIIVSKLVTKIVKPINALARETEKIQRFELEGEVKIDSRIKEVVRLADAVQSMKSGLKQFQKYVPKILVRQLIESGEDIRVGGERKELVVLFSDIENFTTIAEDMDANELMLQVGEYFEALSQIITRENGTIDKYIGDSVMAFWGAPLPENEPCNRAARSALLCQEKVIELNANWEKQGQPRLVTRIGIHTGEAIVGNFGSSERLNYTALGDTVNLTSRLEAINKIYKTKIIVSEAVYQNIKDCFVLRMVDCVALKGRKGVSRIYELLSDDISKLSFDLNAYRSEFDKAYMAYDQKLWDDAIIHFKNCMNIYPKDTIAPIFIDKCERFKLQ